MGYTIQKVKFDYDGFPEIYYTEDGKYGEPECKLKGRERAPVLNEQLQKLLPVIIDWNKLDRDAWMVDGKVAQVSIKMVENTKGITIVAKALFLDDAPYAVNATSPYLNPDKLTTPQTMVVNEICKEAVAYLKGQPIQMELVA